MLQQAWRWITGGERRSSTFYPRDPVLADWFGGGGTSSGTYVTPETAMRQTAVYACVKLIAGILGTVPLMVLRELPDGGRERATDHPLYRVLKLQPNRRQTSIRWRKEMMAHFLLRGAAYSRIVSSGGRGVDQLIPLHPDRVRPFLRDNGELGFAYQPASGPREILLQSEVFHLIDLVGPDGVTPISPIRALADSIGLAVAAEGYGSRFFSRDARPGQVLKLPADKKISPEAKARVEAEWDARYGGWQNAHRTTLLVDGMEPVPIGMTNQDAQFLDLRRFQVVDIARIWNIPPHMIGETDKSTSWGTGVEQQTLGFVKYTMSQHFELWEQAIDTQLLGAGGGEEYTADFSIEALQRPDFKTHMEGLQIQLLTGMRTLNEVRRLLDLPAQPGGDRRLQSLNHAQVDADGNVMPLPPRADQGNGGKNG